MVRTTARGDFSHYRLAPGHLARRPGAARRLRPAAVHCGLPFKVECPSDFDCRLRAVLPRAGRRRARDRLPGQGLPGPAPDAARPAEPARAASGANATPPTSGVTLVELLAYVADQLSYRQDAVATEAYLGTARSRVSLRRHARLVDYRVAEGAAARAFLRVRVSARGVVLPAGTQVLTRPPGTGVPPGAPIPPTSPAYQAAMTAGAVVFETVGQSILDVDLDELTFYTWGDEDCCLPAGSTSATLLGHHPRAAAPATCWSSPRCSGRRPGNAADADPRTAGRSG